MKSVCGLVVFCLATALHAEEKALLDGEFRHAAEEGKVSVGEIVRRLKANMPSLETSPPPEEMYFSEAYAAAIKRAQGPEFDELEQLLRAMPVDDLDFDQCFSVYATAMIRRRVAQLIATPVRLEWPPIAEEMPKGLADAPASLRDAWRTYRQVVAPYRAIVMPPETVDAPPKKLPPLEVDLRRVVGKAEPEAWKLLAEHVWGDGCRTSSGVLYHPRNRALLLSFLADGKFLEAAGAALGQFPDSSGEYFESLPVDLLTALGLDWEPVMFGSLLPVTSYSAANHRPAVGSGFAEYDSWRLLATRGSPKTVRQCLELIRWANLDPRNAGEFLAAALGPEPAKPGVAASPRATEIVRITALPPESRREVVAVFAEYLAFTNPPQDLIDVMRTIPSHIVKELRAPLSKLVSHPLHPVGAMAYRLLDEAGLTSDQEKIAPATPPLHFRLQLNGEPLRNVKASLSAFAREAPGTKDSPFACEIAPGRDLTTDENGDIVYSLADSLEPDRLDAVQIRIGPTSHSSDRDDFLDSLPLLDILTDPQPPKPENEWTGPWIVHQVAVSAGDQQVHEIPFRSADLEVNLTASAAIDHETPIKIMLRRAPEPAAYSPEAGVARIAGKAEGRAFFRRLQPGKYAVLIKAAGVADYVSGNWSPVVTCAEPSSLPMEAKAAWCRRLDYSARAWKFQGRAATNGKAWAMANTLSTFHRPASGRKRPRSPVVRSPGFLTKIGSTPWNSVSSSMPQRRRRSISARSSCLAR